MKALKRTIAAIMALVIVGGAAPLIPGGFTALKPITASAEEGSVTFDSATGTLTLSGAVTKAQIREYALKFVKSIVAKEGTILPVDCFKLFEGFENSGNVSHAAFKNVEYIDLSKANTSIVTNMDSMFRCMLKVKSINLSGWNTKCVTDMSEMFYGCPQLQEVNIVDFDTRNVVNMDSMFENCEHLTTLDVSNFNTEKVKRMDKMFKKCLNLPSVDISSFNTISVTNMSEMFYSCGELVTIYASEGFTACDNSDSIFYGCSSLVGGEGTTYKYSNSTSEFARIDGGSSNPGYFTYKEFKDWRSLPFDESTGTLTLTDEVVKEQLDEYRNDTRVKHITTDGTAVLPEDCNHFFTEFTALEDVDFSTIDSTNVTDIGAMFSDCKNLVTVDLTGFNTNRVTSMYAAFAGCSKLKTIYVNKYWDASGTPAEGVNSVNMFYGCTSLVGGNGTTYNSNYIDNTYAYADQGASRPGYLTLVNENYLLNGTLYIKNFKAVDFDAFSGIKKIVALEGSEITSNGTTGLFNANSNPTLRAVTEIDLSKAAISNNIINLNSMFSGCSNLKKVTFPADYTASNVTQMANMFRGCSALTTVNLNGFNTTSLQYTSNMFLGCSSLENIDLSGLKTSSVINMQSMFSNCTSLRSLDLAGFDTSYVGNMSYMFYDCINTTTITVSDKWNVAASCNTSYMFGDCNSLVGGNGTSYAKDRVQNGIYAIIDGKGGQPGYFTNAVTPVKDIKFSHNVSLGNDLSIVYYVPAADLEGCTDIKLTLKKEFFDASGNKTYKTTTINAGAPADNGYGNEYEFRYKGISAKEMGSNVTATLSVKKDGETFTSPEDVYSIKRYATNKLNKSGTPEKLKKLLVDMLNYGAQAQQYFGYNTGDLVNKSLTDAQKALATPFSDSMAVNAEKEVTKTGATAQFSGKNLNLGNNIAIVYFMKFNSGVNKNNVKLELTYTSVTGAKQTVTVPYSKFTKGDYEGEMRYDFAGLSAKDSMQAVTAVIKEGTKEISDKLTYSIPTYAGKKLANSTNESLKEIIRSMLVYYTSAKNYFA